MGLELTSGTLIFVVSNYSVSVSSRSDPSLWMQTFIPKVFRVEYYPEVIFQNY